MLATDLSKGSGLRGLVPPELLEKFSGRPSGVNTLTKAELIDALPTANPAAVGQLFNLFAKDSDGVGTDDVDYMTFICAAAVMADAKPACVCPHDDCHGRFSACVPTLPVSTVRVRGTLPSDGYALQ
jgi:hypothetical protein